MSHRNVYWKGCGGCGRGGCRRVFACCRGANRMSSRETQSEAPRTDCEDILPLNKQMYYIWGWYRACQCFDVIPDASGSLLGKRRPNLRNQMRCHLSLMVEVLDYAQQLCVQDGCALLRINPWRTRRKFEDYNGNRIRGYVKRIDSGWEISQGKTYARRDKCEKKVEN